DFRVRLARVWYHPESGDPLLPPPQLAQEFPSRDPRFQNIDQRVVQHATLEVVPLEVIQADDVPGTFRFEVLFVETVVEDDRRFSQEPLEAQPCRAAADDDPIGVVPLDGDVAGIALY